MRWAGPRAPIGPETATVRADRTRMTSREATSRAAGRGLTPLRAYEGALVPRVESFQAGDSAGAAAASEGSALVLTRAMFVSVAGWRIATRLVISCDGLLRRSDRHDDRHAIPAVDLP